MIPFLTNPLALLALASLPALVMIYRLRRQVQRRLVVSSLMFWDSEKDPQDGGKQVQRFRSSRFFILELLILLFLCLAALGLQFVFRQSQPSLVVVLDDSYSMLAKSPGSSRDRAKSRVLKEMDSGRYPFVRVILARSTPQVVGGVLSSKPGMERVLKRWTCQSEQANLQEAMGLAMRVSGDRAKVLVLTDQRPKVKLHPGRITWVSVGRVTDNIAIVNAARSEEQGKEWALVTLANYGTTDKAVTLQLKVGPGKASLRKIRVVLPRQTEKRLTFVLPPKTPVLWLDLPKDSLDIDNHAVLLPETRQPVRVKLQFRNSSLQALMKRAFQATQKVVWDENNPSLLLTDIPMLPEIPQHVWTFSMLKGPGKSASYAGPYILDHKHPLTQGLALRGTIWSTTKPLGTLAQPLVYVGKIPLFSVSSRLDDGVHIRMWYDPSLSTLHRTPDWPILIWNLVAWRQQRQPGLRETNLQLGASAEIRVQPGVKEVTVLPPKPLAPLNVQTRGNSISLATRKVGVYHVTSGGQTYSFAVNTLSRSESNVSTFVPGTYGGWEGALASQQMYQDVSWLFGLLGLSLLLVHLFWMSRASKSE